MSWACRGRVVDACRGRVSWTCRGRVRGAGRVADLRERVVHHIEVRPQLRVVRRQPSTIPPEYRIQCGFSPVGGMVHGALARACVMDTRSAFRAPRHHEGGYEYAECRGRRPNPGGVRVLSSASWNARIRLPRLELSRVVTVRPCVEFAYRKVPRSFVTVRPCVEFAYRKVPRSC